jgi:cytochrome c oxidase cbb3-type subunit 2
MPAYSFLGERRLEFGDAADHLRALRAVGVPYTDDQVAAALDDLKAQANGEEGDTDALLARYPKAKIGDFDGNPALASELDALIAYVQMLGTLIDFTDYQPERDYR